MASLPKGSKDIKEVPELNIIHFHTTPGALSYTCHALSGEGETRGPGSKSQFLPTHSIWGSFCSQTKATLPLVTSVSLLRTSHSQCPSHREGGDSHPESDSAVTLPLHDT